MRSMQFLRVFILASSMSQIIAFAPSAPRTFSSTNIESSSPIIYSTQQRPTLQLQATIDRETKKTSSNRSEVSRMKFIVNQMKGNMQESEMRATAAENRVAMLQKQIRQLEQDKKEVDGKVDEEAMNKLKAEHEKKVSVLEKTIAKLQSTFDIFKKDSKEEITSLKSGHEKELSDMNAKYQTLENELQKAQEDLTSAQKEVQELKEEIKALEQEMKEKIKNLEEEMKQKVQAVTEAKDVEISNIKVDAEDKRTVLLKENEELEVQLKTALDGSAQLKRDLAKAKLDLTNELLQFKEKTQKELDAVEKSLSTKESELETMTKRVQDLEDEKSSLRSLFRNQRKLVRERISKRLKRRRH